LNLKIEEIEKLVKDYDQDSKAIKDELFRICWYMRGGVTYTESMLLSYEDREIIGKIIESNLATTKDSGMPFF
jgi:hypothetical protein